MDPRASSPWSHEEAVRNFLAFKGAGWVNLKSVGLQRGKPTPDGVYIKIKVYLITSIRVP